MQDTCHLNFQSTKHRISKAVYKVNEAEEKKAKARTAAEGMVADNIEQSKTISYLMDAGYSSEEAKKTVRNIKKIRRSVREKKAQKKMVIGALWVLFSMVVTVVSYRITLFGGSNMFIAGLGIIYGSFHFFKGISIKRHI